VLRSIAVAVLALALLPAAASAATVDRDAQTGSITIIDDVGVADNIFVQRTGDVDTISRDGGGLTNNSGDCSGGGAAPVACPAGSSFAVDLGDGNDVFDADDVRAPVNVAGGSGNDNLAGSMGPDVLAGGPDDDTLRGEGHDGGIDDFFGETGDDVITARDANPERISCGGGTDEVDNDFTDIIAECERGTDSDNDGFSTAVDCDDGAANIHPGAPEVFDNGVDENCDGRDNPNLDRDADGFAQPIDCDDGNGAIKPGALEIRGNAVDENCDRTAEPFAQLGAIVTNQWVVLRRFTRLTALVVHNAPKGARITLSCKGRGCPFKRPRRRTVSRELQRIVLHRSFRRARLRSGARVRLVITAAGSVGRTYTFVVKRGEVPRKTTTCRAPGQAKGRSC
jgi:hypothetical protein